MTLQQGNQQLLFQLYHLYEEREARNIADLVMEEVTEWKKIDRVLNKQYVLSDRQEKELQQFTQELSTGKPVQYVLRNAWFYGMKFFVDDRVLLPRPETEELVKWVVDTCGGEHTDRPLRILDIGTGSGCIPVSIKKTFPPAEIFSCDISKEALDVAALNARKLGAEITLLAADVLDPAARAGLPRADIIVSNPPYIPIDEKDTMAAGVTAFEPHVALFVPQQDPLLFYQAIISLARLQEATVQVFVEIHENYGEAVTALFQTMGFSEVTLREDLQGRPRMLRAVKQYS